MSTNIRKILTLNAQNVSECLSINGYFAQYLRLPCEMRSLFLWGYAQKLTLGISTICLRSIFSHVPPGLRPYGPEAGS